MAPLPATGLVVRWLHLLGVAVLLGGTTLTWWLVRQRVADPVDAGRGYEYLFWLAAGVVVLTGVGSAGALGPAVPDPGTGRGRALVVKLLGVAGLLVLSAVRTLAIVVLAGTEGAATVDGDTTVDAAATADRTRSRTVVRTSYAATGWYLAGLVALGEVVAHG